MKIAIDCRYIGMSGMGTVCRGLIEHLDYGENEYYLIGKKESLIIYPCAKIIEDDSAPYSRKGLFSFSKELNKVCDALIVPNFLIPFGVKIPVYIIMHDLIFLDLPKITTRGRQDYLLKKFLIKRGIKRAEKVFCVSGFTKSRCEHYFPKYAGKFIVDHIGVSDEVMKFDTDGIEKTNALVYVGNVKPHKGIKTLISAFSMLPENKFVLKIIGEREGFLTGMKEEFDEEGVIFTGKLDNEVLMKEIASAAFLVQPSLYEGFGLPPIEALTLGTRPIISDIPVFKEVYGDFPVVFFKTGDAEDLKNAILNADEKMPIDALNAAKRYNFEKFADKMISNITGR